MNKIICGDSLIELAKLPAGIVQTCVTSPPYYGLRQYLQDGDDGKEYEIGLEQTPEEFISRLVAVFREVKRVLRPDGTLWVNMGDSYVSNTGDRNKVGGFQANPSDDRLLAESAMSFNKKSGNLKSKDLIGIPWMLAFALRADGWYLRSDIIWHKPNPMPESVTDRPTKSHEHIFLLSKQAQYYYDADAIKEEAAYDGRKDELFKGSEKYKDSGQTFAKNGHPRWNVDDKGVRVRNKRDVWTVSTKPMKSSEYGNGKPGRVSPDCPLHGRLAQSRKSYIPSGDEQQEVDSIHIFDTDDYHGQECVSELKARNGHNHAEVSDGNAHVQIPESTGENKISDPQNEHTSDAQNPDRNMRKSKSDEQQDYKTDYQNPLHSEIAIPHNNQTNRTDRAPQTSPRDNVSAQTLFDTQNNGQSVSLSGLVDRKHENNTSMDDLNAHPSGHTDDGNADKSFPYDELYCTCDKSSIAHFATFPRDLIVPCILAGSKPGDIVLDPFGGAGTTAKIAQELGREYITIELNQKYVDTIIKPRLLATNVPLFAG